ncbi:Multidrug resistance protein mexA precursor [Serratia rubidaea]|uniref:Multidrug resistance protein mexA n=1 Tax=Serratia rubidaea TaxID=61652 RepID=A0A4V6JH45_SERRU|nr:efflux RND transporter periplasmic adaptor subunit [Serratia rubidaea]MBD8452075.1 efflux RND transporter periplasmic adaptor subunit [Serratia rubidaea]QPR62741.1 efflux RND transporter periplasmic adaptor subunit [Serratia rubidaea]CAI0809255.1 Multidrug resistance protein mexA precursor [Serratia rubidaea]CAI1615471.1 Multidrug resistance protein mexA precursor [Serratia rubidaea]VTP62673.1 Multidrug resistance protein mexA precursor [Serratia rubidaea]
MRVTRVALFGLSLLLSGCDRPSDAPAAGPLEVGVRTLQARPVTLSSELSGRVTAAMSSEVRPQVDGIIKRRLFTEGAEVKAGQLLYQIDPASYQASYDQALAQLQNARATVKSSRLKAQRYAALVKENGVSQQDADDAQASYQQALASVAQYRAAVASAKVNLDYTQVRAPIAGRIGISAVTPGALVTAGQSDALATIRALDPIYIDLTQSSSQLLKLRKRLAGVKTSQTVPVKVQLEDGTAYAQQGKLALTEVAVDESTGSVTLRAVVPNPQHQLLPGMYVRATVENGVDPQAILAPQQGIGRDADGNATAWVVNRQNQVEQRRVVTDRVIGSSWLVTSGLQAGDRLIVEGTDKVKAGSRVSAVEVATAKDKVQ